MRLFCYLFLLKKHEKIQNREKLCSSACFLGVKKDGKRHKKRQEKHKKCDNIKIFLPKI